MECPFRGLRTLIAVPSDPKNWWVTLMQLAWHQGCEPGFHQAP
jgi:hypothetical protein